MSIFIVAEIGINHNGDMSICKELIDVAVNSGCDAVKFQKRDLDKVYTQEFLDSPRESQWGTTQREQKSGLEFSKEQYGEISQYCKEKNIEWFASAWDLNSQKFLQKFDCKYNKIASAMIVYEDLLKMVAREGKHTFISTGMTTYDDIQKAVNIFRGENCSFELMYTVSTYPMKDENANLNMIETLRKKFDCDVGYSGHEYGLEPTIFAAVLGALIIERHITLDHEMWGTDQSASVELMGMDMLYKRIRNIKHILGDGEKTITESEILVRKKLRGY